MSTHGPALAVILARAGSKGLPGKNALRLGGRPMIEHTIDDARAATSVGRVIVSTDCPAVTAAARARGVAVVRRPAPLASDIATVDAAARHAVEAIGATEAIIVLLYGNVPLRPDDLIDRAVNELCASGADSVQSYSEVGKHHPYWMVTLEGAGRVKPWTDAGAGMYRRQDLPRVLIPDGGVIAVTRASLFTALAGEPHAFLGRDRRGIVSERGSVVDIDEPLDLAVAEAILVRDWSPACP